MARQRLGQHFLVDETVIARILRVVSPASGDVFLEIGPGRGALTVGLLAAVGDGMLEAVEVDERMVAHLNATLGADNAHWRLHFADILHLNFDSLRDTPKRRIIGNLPYQISSPLLMRLLSDTDRIADMHFMLQLEVAERLCAAVGSAHYSALSVLVNCRATCEKLFEVEPASFAPPPEVRSAFVRLTPISSPSKIDVADWSAFQNVVRLAFTHRRKKLWRALDGHFSVAQLEALGIDPHCRPQNLSAADYARLARSQSDNAV